MNEYNDNARTWIVLEQHPNDGIKRDLSSTMLPPVNKCPLTEQQLKTIFYRIRSVDAYGSLVELLQVFFSHFPRGTKLQTRHPGKGKEPGESH